MATLCNELQPALAVISGGLGDIGQAIASSLKHAGADVALSDLAETCSSDFHFYHPLDVSDAEATEKWYDLVESHFSRIPNLIIVNAAIVTAVPLLQISAKEWQREIEINLNGAFHFSRAGAKRLVSAGQPGRIIFLGSWAAHAPHPRLPAYSVAKAGLRMLMQTLALEIAPYGILVNEVAPGYVHAGLSKQIFNTDPTRETKAREAVPIQKLIPAEAVAQQVLALCSPLSSYTTGSTMLQDGGLSLLQGPPL